MHLRRPLRHSESHNRSAAGHSVGVHHELSKRIHSQLLDHSDGQAVMTTDEEQQAEVRLWNVTNLLNIVQLDSLSRDADRGDPAQTCTSKGIWRFFRTTRWA
jgi:hypothetical protein